jgi:hypothetical protein
MRQSAAPWVCSMATVGLLDGAVRLELVDQRRGGQRIAMYAWIRQRASPHPPDRHNKDVSPSCPRCGGTVRPPDLMHSDWRCDRCGPVSPLHTTKHISADVLAAVRNRVASADGRVPLWCPWPLPSGWTVTGVAWAGDDRSGPRATALALTGPAPLADGPADLVFVAEELGTGLGMGLAGRPETDPGECVLRAVGAGTLASKVRADGHPTPLWAVSSLEDRCALAGEARGLWLFVVGWPATAGYLLAEAISLIDLGDSAPQELVFGAPSARLSSH